METVGVCLLICLLAKQKYLVLRKDQTSITKYISPLFRLKFMYSEKATKFCEIFSLLLTVCTVVKSKGKISQNFVAFSEYMNFNNDGKSGLEIFILKFTEPLQIADKLPGQFSRSGQIFLYRAAVTLKGLGKF